MGLTPLRQWICDSCHQTIESPKEGYVQWRTDNLRSFGFSIVHHQAYSPRGPVGSCYDPEALSDLQLDKFLGADGLIYLLSLVDPGEHFVQTLEQPYVSDFRGWTEIVKRLQIPYYEEARQHFGQMEAEGYMSDANEVSLYLPETLQDIIRRYSRERSE